MEGYGSKFIYQKELAKIDNLAVEGLLGTEDSLAYKVHEIEKHLHNTERWIGQSADQSGNNWAADTLTAFQAISGNGVYGADADDEAKVIGSDDTALIAGAGNTKFDFHEILIVDASVNTAFKLRIVYGTGAMADAITAGQYSEKMVIADSVNPQLSSGIPFAVTFPRQAAGTKIWIQCKNATDNATIDFFTGGHGYPG